MVSARERVSICNPISWNIIIFPGYKVEQPNKEIIQKEILNISQEGIFQTLVGRLSAQQLL